MPDPAHTQWLCLLSPARPTFPGDATPDEVAHVQAHFERLVALHAEGVVILAGRTQDEPPIGLVIFEAPDEEAARELVGRDPVVANGVMTYELRPYTVAIPTTGLL